MKVEVNIDKKWAVGVVVSILILAGAIFVVALWDPAVHRVWHDANDVKVTLGGADYSLQEAFDSGYATGAWLCFNDDAKQPCVDASANGGGGSKGYRVINCQHPTLVNIVGRSLKYTNSEWWFYTSEDFWKRCRDGTVLVMKASGP